MKKVNLGVWILKTKHLSVICDYLLLRLYLLLIYSLLLLLTNLAIAFYLKNLESKLEERASMVHKMVESLIEAKERLDVSLE
jgi:hypothetical protein